MKRPIWASEYLDLADKLAGRGAGRGRPRTAHLRRATSTAYYALFHMLATQGAHWMRAYASADERAVVARWFTHGNIRKAATWVSDASQGRNPPAGVKVLLNAAAIPRDLAFVASAFVELQDARHAADYDPLYDAQKYETLEHVDLARQGVDAAHRQMDELWAAATKSEARPYGAFLLLALGGERMVKNNG